MTVDRKLSYTEVKFYPKVKSQSSLSLLRVSYKRALILVAKFEDDCHQNKTTEVSCKKSCS